MISCVVGARHACDQTELQAVAGYLFARCSQSAVVGATSRRLWAGLRADGERSPSWLATLRLDGACGTSPSAPVDRLRRSRSTSVEHLPVRPQPAIRFQSGAWRADRCGVFVCEALRERSEQRVNKHPEVGQRTASSQSRFQAPDNHALNFRSTFVDLGDLRIPKIAFQR